MNSDVKKYIHDIKLLFPVFQKEEKDYFRRFSESILKETNSEELSYQDCIERFGEPKDILISYYEEINSENLIKKIKNQHLIRKLFYVFTIAIIIISLLACAVIFKSYSDAKENYYSYSENIVKVK